MAISDVTKMIRNYKAREKQLNSDRRKAFDRERKASVEFIADSHKCFMRCSCGMTDEVWAFSSLIISVAKGEWKKRHKKCEGKGIEFFDR